MSITEPTAAEHDFGPEWKNQMVRQAMDGVRAARELAGLPPMPTIVCLCGSTRFKDEINAANARLTMQGVLVISLGVFGHTDLPDRDWTTGASDDKRMLDNLHRRKIDLADEVLIVSDETGYFGESTRGEIAYAVAQGKPVRFARAASLQRALEAGLLGMTAGGPHPCDCGPDDRCSDCTPADELATAMGIAVRAIIKDGTS